MIKPKRIICFYTSLWFFIGMQSSIAATHTEIALNETGTRGYSVLSRRMQPIYPKADKQKPGDSALSTETRVCKVVYHWACPYDVPLFGPTGRMDTLTLNRMVFLQDVPGSFGLSLFPAVHPSEKTKPWHAAPLPTGIALLLWVLGSYAILAFRRYSWRDRLKEEADDAASGGKKDITPLRIASTELHAPAA